MNLISLDHVSVFANSLLTHHILNRGCNHFLRKSYFTSTAVLLKSQKVLVTKHVGVRQQHRSSLPVMVGYDGSQSSDTYSVAHQVDFLTQKVFHAVKKEQGLLSVSCRQI